MENEPTTKSNAPHILRVNPTRAAAIGLNEDIFLSQLLYWLERSNTVIDDKVWVYNTHEQWRAQFPFWSTRTIQRTVYSLRRQGIILTRTDNITNYYTIDEVALSKLTPGVSPKWREGLAKSVFSSIIHRLPKRGRVKRALKENDVEDEYVDNTYKPKGQVS